MASTSPPPSTAPTGPQGRPRRAGGLHLQLDTVAIRLGGARASPHQEQPRHQDEVRGRLRDDFEAALAVVLAYAVILPAPANAPVERDEARRRPDAAARCGEGGGGRSQETPPPATRAAGSLRAAADR